VSCRKLAYVSADCSSDHCPGRSSCGADQQADANTETNTEAYSKPCNYSETGGESSPDVQAYSGPLGNDSATRGETRSKTFHRQQTERDFATRSKTFYRQQAERDFATPSKTFHRQQAEREHGKAGGTSYG
jgi:hypothetical protein